MGAWFVPLGTVLDSNGLHALKPYAFASSAIAAFISPLIFGAMADRHIAPVRVLRWLALATSAAMLMTAVAIGRGASPWLILAFLQLHSLCSAPTWGISTSIVLGRLSDSRRQFGPIRALGSLGWMVGCWLVSALHADASTTACYTAALVWLLVVVLTYWLPSPAPPKSSERLTIPQRLGWDALVLLKSHDHRVVFLTTALFAIPLAAFYPYAPTHLRALGLERTAAWMTLGQVTEIIAMLALATLISRLRLKWTVALGLTFGVIRFALCAMDSHIPVLAGVTLHGFSFTLVYITAQIYLDHRVDPSWRVRAQALFSVMTSGVGNLAGYLGTGWWFNFSSAAGQVNWTLFWGGLSTLVALILLFFLATYRGKKAPFRQSTPELASH
ncbi:MAG: hypothetical protein JWL90_1995 [Chthoniobacteraceae bacterium]|nr:hypothetical protein [Chthoniobacteraceae bacterium]